VPKALFASLLVASSAALAGLDDLGRIDAVAVDETSGQVGLLLVVDRSLEDGLTKRRIERKLGVYATYVESQYFLQKYPYAKTSIGVSVEIRHPPKGSALGGVVLEHVGGKCRELRFRCIFNQYERAVSK
jgi:hypothetical protein